MRKKFSKIRKTLLLGLTAALVLGQSAVAFAAPTPQKSYTYTVRIHAGNIGVIDEKCIDISQIPGAELKSVKSDVSAMSRVIKATENATGTGTKEKCPKCQTEDSYDPATDLCDNDGCEVNFGPCSVCGWPKSLNKKTNECSNPDCETNNSASPSLCPICLREGYDPDTGICGADENCEQNLEDCTVCGWFNSVNKITKLCSNPDCETNITPEPEPEPEPEPDEPKVYVQDLIITGIPLGSQLTFKPQSAVKIIDSEKYYVRGIKRSGWDKNYVKNANVNLASITVTEDMDFSIDYGVIGDKVEYTLNYINAATGGQLGASETFYGNRGDVVMLAAPYFEGYLPEAWNYKFTLNEDSRSININYNVNTNTTTTTETAEGATPTPTPTPTPTATPAAGTVIAGTTAGTTGNAPGATPEDIEDGTTPGANTDAGTGEGEGDGTDANTPQEIIDLDDEDVPLTDTTIEPEAHPDRVNNSPVRLPVIIVGIAAGAAAIAAILVVIIKKKPL